MLDQRNSALSHARAVLADVESRASEGRESSGAIGFGVRELDDRLRGGGLRLDAVHDVAAARSTLADDAAATLFAAGAASRLAACRGVVLWIRSGTDLYAPGIEQAGLRPDIVLYADAREDAEALALAEDALADGTPSAIVAEIRRASLTSTRRLQLGCERAGLPVLLLRRRRRVDRCPLGVPSAAATRWRIGAVPSPRLDVPGLGRARWLVELVRQRGGDAFSLNLEACDGEGRLALPAAARDRAAAAGGAAAARAA